MTIVENERPVTADVVPIRPGVGDWQQRFVYTITKHGPQLDNCTANGVTALRNEPEWRGVLAWDEFKQAIVCRKQPPWFPDDAPANTDLKRPWSDTDGVRVQNWLRRKHKLSLSPKESYYAALVVAEANSFDPVKDWIASLEHDGIARVSTWMHRYLGVEDTPYTRFVARAFIVSSIARVLVPGEKVDTMPIWEGPQGLYKSQAARALFGEEWFSDTPLELGTKDRFVGLRGLLCHEMAELDGWGKADPGRIKTFLSSPVDDYRPPYGQHNVRVKRRCVMLGTVNPGPFGYLVDNSGNRRMWPVRCGAVGPIDLDGIARDRDQLWAEARVMYGDGPKRGGVRWWPITDEERRLCNEEQEGRLIGDVWLGKIETWLSEGHRPEQVVTVREILGTCLGVETAKQDRGAAARVGGCLAQLGWEVVARAGSGTRERYYAKRPDPDIERKAIEGEPPTHA